MRKTKFRAMALAISLMLAFTWSCGSGEKPPLLDRETIKGWLSKPEVIILDVRVPKDWNPSDKKIKGAVHQDPDEVATWAVNLPNGPGELKNLFTSINLQNLASTTALAAIFSITSLIIDGTD